jgi:hypothetical protein
VNIHCVAFVAVTLDELQSGAAFREAARFCQWDATVVIRCEQVGQELQMTCPASSMAHSAARFRSAWERKNGRIL